MKKSSIETSRLYVTSDKHHDGAYFARTNKNIFARFYHTGFDWEIWIYPFKMRWKAASFTETMKRIEWIFKKYWSEKNECRRTEQTD